MKTIKKIEESIKNLKVTSGDKIHNRILNKLNLPPEKSKPTTIYQQNIWRLIMKSKITKLTAAAILIIAAMVGINHLGGSIDGTTVAWAQVIEQLSKHERYKCRQRVVRENGPEIPAMNVYHFNLSLRRQEVEDGSIHIIDMRARDAVTVQLYPDQKKAIVKNLIGFGPKKDPDIIEMVKRFQQASSESLGTKKQDGKTLYGFRHQPNEYNDFTVWVDTKTKLPVEIKLIHPNVPQTIFMDQFEFDFDLDPSAFSTEVPAGYKVQTINHYYGSFETKEIAFEDIELNHAVYSVEKLSWMENIVTIETLDPLGGKSVVYITGIKSDDGNLITIVQGDYYDISMMEWISQQNLEMVTQSGINIYDHPKGSVYAKYFMKSFIKEKSGFFDNKLGKKGFTRMIVMPNGTVLGLAASKQLSNEKIKEIIEALREVEK